MPSALVTGASSGIGRATALALAEKGYTVTVAGRSEERLRPVVAAIGQIGAAALSLVFDLSSLRSVRSAARSLLAEGTAPDVLINDAGVGVNRGGVTEDGFEARFGINHLGHFLLTILLADTMAHGSTVVTVASDAHRHAHGIDFDRLRRPGGLIGFGNYAVSKLANILFTRELARRLPRLRAHAVHPGLVDTGIIPAMVKPFLRGRMLTPEQGADTVVWCATELDAPGGGYYSRRAVATPSPAAQDDDLARELWERSAEWTATFRP